MRNKTTLDYETKSEADLKKVGAYEYARHPSTEIICLAYKINGGKTKIWRPGERFPSELILVFRRKDFELHAHNAYFEQVITRFVLVKYFDLECELPPERWFCTAAKAAAVAIPRNLEMAARVMRLSQLKDMAGSRVMKKYMKPTRKWTTWANAGRVGPEPQKWYDDEFELADIYDYCKTDVEVEELLDATLPDLSPYERKVWLINQKMNLRGIQVDVATVKKIIAQIKEESITLEKEFRQITKLESVGQRDKLLKWLVSQGVNLENMRAKTIADALDSGKLPKLAHRVLEIRSQVSKTSNKKYNAFIDRAGTDGRVRDLSLYHGASTGRESGTGLQIQNLPKGKVKNILTAIDVIQKEGLEGVKFYYPKPFDVYSSCIRGMITSSKDHELAVADYNAIECRILNWLAGNKEVLTDFAKGKDPYKKQASFIYSKPQDEITDDERFVGKIAELACGYQMGASRFLQTCIDWGAKGITEDLAKKAVKSYRDTHQPVVRLWGVMEKAAIHAVKKPGVKVTIAKVTWLFKDNFLWCTLPSGRKIAYFGAMVKMKKAPWGESLPKLYYWYMDPLTKQWVNGPTYGGSIVENICQATAACVTRNGVMNASEAGYQFMFQVHDEIICESKNVDLPEYERLLTTLPKWADGLPVKVGSWRGFRYRKG